jgi:hypothetical protein
MVVLQTKNNHIFEIDSTMLEDTKEFLKKLSKKNIPSSHILMS